MQRALVLGNGESRASLNLELFKNSHTILGCNALHRDFLVDHLICCDQRMVREVLENQDYKTIPIWVREDWYNFFRKIQKNKNIRQLPDLPYSGKNRADESRNWGSGPYAILTALSLGHTAVDLVGFDLWGIGKRVNNLYKGTKNYSGRESSAIDPSYWIYQISKLISLNPNIEFNFINRQEWDLPTEWRTNNVKKTNITVDRSVNTLYNLQIED